MKNKSIIVFATLMLFTACSNRNTLIKKEVKVKKLPSPTVEPLEDIFIVEADKTLMGEDDCAIPPGYYSIGKDSP